jgi:hypothetical protein
MSTRRPPTTCPRCGTPVPTRPTGRPAVWCSQGCRRAAYEERRAAARGAIAIAVVERPSIVEHNLTECVARVTRSPAACRRVLQTLTTLAENQNILTDPKWESTIRVAEKLDAAIKRHRGGRRL